MKKIAIEKRHSLSEAECQVLISSLADQLVRQFGGSSTKGDNELRYHHSSGAQGCLTYSGDRILIEVDVPFLMRPLAYKIEEEIHAHCDKHL